MKTKLKLTTTLILALFAVVAGQDGGALTGVAS